MFNFGVILGSREVSQFGTLSLFSSLYILSTLAA